MCAGIRIESCKNVIIEDCYFGDCGIAIDLESSQAVYIDGLKVQNNSVSNHLKLYGGKLGRNDLCPCGSGVKIKKCYGVSSMSTGIRSDNSTFTVGKATIVAETGVDLKNNSDAHIEELIFYSPDTPASLAQVLMSLPAQPPRELVVDAIEQQKTKGTIEGSRLWGWRYVSRYLSPWYFLRLPIEP